MAPFKKRIIRKSTKKPTVKKVIKRAVTKAKSALFSKAVRRVIQRTEEKKTQQSSGFINFGAYTSSSLLNQINPITPYNSAGITIAQGVGAGDRIGNKIRVVSQHINGVIVPNTYDATLNPFPEPLEVRVWFFSLKNSNTLPTTLPNFFQLGDTDQTPQGTILDLTRKVNTDTYIYRGHRTYKLGTASNAASAGALAPRDYYANNDFKFNIRFDWDVTKIVPKNVTFDDTVNTATSKAVFYFIEAVNADGTSQSAASLPAKIYYTNTLVYTDA